MVLELGVDVTPSVEIQPQAVEVFYGTAESANRNETILTGDVLDECVGVVLSNRERVGFAHFPLQDSFKVFDGEKRVRRTFADLSQLLFDKFGPISQDTQATIVGGVEGRSEPLIQKLQEVLRNKGIKGILINGPHSEKVAWDVSINRGAISISAQRMAGK